jgi:NAD(P)-dependent dehydrogenase (short-subunit alcohol dehydrogenase family)
MSSEVVSEKMAAPVAGKVCVVTGGGSSIGAAICRRFAELGAQAVVVVDMNEQAAKIVADEIGGTSMCCDMGQEADVHRVIKNVEASIGPIGVFVSHAELPPTLGKRPSNTDWQHLLNANVLSHIYAAQKLFPLWQQRDGDKHFVLSFPSDGLPTSEKEFLYSLSKYAAIGMAALFGFTQAVHGIHVSCLSPEVFESGPSSCAGILESAGDVAFKGLLDHLADALAHNRFGILPHSEKHWRGICSRGKEKIHGLSEISTDMEPDQAAGRSKGILKNEHSPRRKRRVSFSEIEASVCYFHVEKECVQRELDPASDALLQKINVAHKRRLRESFPDTALIKFFGNPCITSEASAQTDGVSKHPACSESSMQTDLCLHASATTQTDACMQTLVSSTGSTEDCFESCAHLVPTYTEAMHKPSCTDVNAGRIKDVVAEVQEDMASATELLREHTESDESICDPEWTDESFCTLEWPGAPAKVEAETCSNSDICMRTESSTQADECELCVARSGRRQGVDSATQTIFSKPGVQCSFESSTVQTDMCTSIKLSEIKTESTDVDLDRFVDGECDCSFELSVEALPGIVGASSGIKLGKDHGNDKEQPCQGDHTPFFASLLGECVDIPNEITAEFPPILPERAEIIDKISVRGPMSL